MKPSDMNHNPTSIVCYWWRCHCTHHYFISYECTR